LNYLDVSKVHTACAQFIEENYSQAYILTVFPFEEYFIHPEYGYVSKRLSVIRYNRSYTAFNERTFREKIEKVKVAAKERDVVIVVPQFPYFSENDKFLSYLRKEKKTRVGAFRLNGVKVFVFDL